MEEIPGQRQNSRRFIHGGFTYYIDSNTYRCMKRSINNCPGRAVVGPGGIIVVEVGHTHIPEKFIMERAAMRDELLHLSRETVQPLRQIFDDVSERQNPNVAQLVSYNSVRSSMERERAKARPPTPRTLDELSRTLEGYQRTALIYRGRVVSTDGSIAVIFASNEMLAELNMANEIYADGTFKVVPDRLFAVQLYIVHIRVMAVGFPAIYAFFERQTKALYIAVWQRIIELAPGLIGRRISIMGDYEKAAILAIRQTLPEAAIHGCWFHFNQAILRKWKFLGLSDAPRDVPDMTVALPLLPHMRFNDGLNAVETAANPLAQEFPQVLVFVQYLRRQWAPLAEVVSVCGIPVRTNNIAELFHRHLAQKLGGHNQNIWTFLDRLVKLTTKENLELVRIKRGMNIRRTMSTSQMQHEARIREAQARLYSGVYTMAEFLRNVIPRNHNVDLQVAVQRAPIEVNEEMELADRIDLRPIAEIIHPDEQDDGPPQADTVGPPVADQINVPIRFRGRNRGRLRGRGRVGGRGRGIGRGRGRGVGRVPDNN